MIAPAAGAQGVLAVHRVWFSPYMKLPVLIRWIELLLEDRDELSARLRLLVTSAPEPASRCQQTDGK